MPLETKNMETNNPNPSLPANLQQHLPSKWYQHKGLIAIFILVIITIIVSYVYFKKTGQSFLPASMFVNKAGLFYPKKDKIVIFKFCAPEDMQGNRGVCVKDGQIYLVEFPSQKVTQITKVKSTKSSPKIFNNNIVWLDERAKQVAGQEENANSTGIHMVDFLGQDVYSFNLDTKKETKLTSTTARRTELVMYGNKVSWTENNNSVDYLGATLKYLHIYDLEKNKEIYTDTSKGTRESLAINKNYLVWMDTAYSGCTPNICDTNPGTVGCENIGSHCPVNSKIIMGYDFNSNLKKSLVIDKNYKDPWLSLRGNSLVWQERIGREWTFAIYEMDLTTMVQNQITDSNLSPSLQVLNGKALRTVVSGCDMPAQNEAGNGVYLYDISTKQTEKLSNADHSKAELYDEMVVIEDDNCLGQGPSYGILTN